MNMKTIEDVFIHLLSDTYSAEKQLTRALAKLAKSNIKRKIKSGFSCAPRGNTWTD
ncbi:YciF protein [Escherichia coli]|nr:YciF protein [Escherichia coli]